MSNNNDGTRRTYDMLKVIVVENNTTLKDNLIKTIECTGLAHVIGDAENGLSGINLVRNKNPDLVFINIGITPINGIDTVRIINSIHRPPGVIFVTNHKHHAHEAFELNAIDFVIKPITCSRVMKALNRAYSFFNIKQEIIIFRTQHQIIYLRPNEIFFFEVVNRKVIIHCQHKTLIINENLKMVEEKLINISNFLKSHRSYIVNKFLIDVIVKSEGIKSNSYEIRFKNYDKVAYLSHEKLPLFI